MKPGLWYKLLIVNNSITGSSVTLREGCYWCYSRRALYFGACNWSEWLAFSYNRKL